MSLEVEMKRRQLLRALLACTALALAHAWRAPSRAQGPHRRTREQRVSLSARGSDGEMARRALLARGAAVAAALVTAAGPAAAGDDALLTLPLMKAPQTLFALKPDYTDAVAPSSSTADAGAAAAGGGDADADGAPTSRPPLPPLERRVDPACCFYRPPSASMAPPAGQPV